MMLQSTWNAIKQHRLRMTSSLKYSREVHVLIQELGIHSGYRPLGTPFKSCLASLTVCTNETLNVWTHALPALLTCMYTLWYAMYADEDFDESNLHSTFRWPCIFFLVATGLHLTISALAHTFNSLSFCSYQICFLADYTAISITGLSIAVANDAYAFLPSANLPHDVGLYRKLFLPIGALLTVAFTYVACDQRYKLHFTSLKVCVLSVSVLHYCWVYYPIVVRILSCGSPCSDTAVNYYYYHLLLMLLSGLVFGLHFPEIISPGTYDLLGHSHQLFHVMNFLASIFMYLAIRSDMHALKSNRSKDLNLDIINESRVGIMLIVPTINVLIMAHFVRKVMTKKRAKT